MYTPYVVYFTVEFCSEMFVHRSCHLLTLHCLQVNLSKTFDLHAAAGTSVVSEFCNSQIENKSLSSALWQYNSLDYLRTKKHY